MLEDYEASIKNITLIPSGGGAYEVTLNGSLIYSKLQNGRHAEPGEVKALVRKFIEEG